MYRGIETLRRIVQRLTYVTFNIVSMLINRGFADV
jgi:hypothetical protein